MTTFLATIDQDGRGECPECGRRFKVNARGLIVRHGFARCLQGHPGGERCCRGSGNQPVRDTLGGQRVTG